MADVAFLAVTLAFFAAALAYAAYCDHLLPYGQSV
jgi:hypothetical protein